MMRVFHMPPPPLFYFRCNGVESHRGRTRRGKRDSLKRQILFMRIFCYPPLDSRGVGKDGGMPHTFLLGDDQWLCLHDVDPAFEMFFFFLLLLPGYSYMGFCGLGCPEEEDGPREGGGGPPAPLCTFMKSSYVTCLPHCFQRFVINA